MNNRIYVGQCKNTQEWFRDKIILTKKRIKEKHDKRMECLNWMQQIEVGTEEYLLGEELVKLNLRMMDCNENKCSCNDRIFVMYKQIINTQIISLTKRQCEFTKYYFSGNIEKVIEELNKYIISSNLAKIVVNYLENKFIFEVEETRNITSEWIGEWSFIYKIKRNNQCFKIEEKHDRISNHRYVSLSTVEKNYEIACNIGYKYIKTFDNAEKEIKYNLKCEYSRAYAKETVIRLYNKDMFENINEMFDNLVYITQNIKEIFK